MNDHFFAGANMSILYKQISTGLFLLVTMLLSACQTVESNHPPDNAKDVLFAQQLWEVMKDNRLVGNQAITLQPFFGGAKPHGMILEIYSHQLMMGKHNGFLVLKRNYNGDDVSIENVSKNRSKYLSSITIMYQREDGYDKDNLRAPLLILCCAD